MSEERKEAYTADEIKEIIDSGDLEFINDLSAGNIKQLPEGVEAPIETVLEQTEAVVPEVVETPSPEPVEAIIEEVSQVPTLFDESVTALEDKLKTTESDLTSKLSEKEQEIADWKEKYRLAEEQKVVSAPVAKPLEFNETEDDLDLASTVSKNNRAQISQLSEKLNNVTTADELAEIKKTLSALQAGEEERTKQAAIAKKESDRKEYMNNLFGEIKTFSAGKDHLKLSKDISTRYEEHNDLRKRVGEYLHTDKRELVNKALYGIAFNESPFYTDMKGNLAKIGVEVPEDTGTYLKLSEIVDLKDGIEYDHTTGKQKNITDSRGNVICQRNIEDAYKLSKYQESITQARTEQTEAITQALSTKANAAVTLPQGVINDAEANTAMTSELAIQIFNMDETAIRKNPDLMKKYNEALKFIGQ